MTRQVTEQQVADALAETWHDYQDWYAVAREMLTLLGDTDAHRRIDGLRETVKDGALAVAELREQVSRLTGANACLHLEIIQLREQVRNEGDINDLLRRELRSEREGATQ